MVSHANSAPPQRGRSNSNVGGGGSDLKCPVPSCPLIFQDPETLALHLIKKHDNSKDKTQPRKRPRSPTPPPSPPTTRRRGNVSHDDPKGKEDKSNHDKRSNDGSGSGDGKNIVNVLKFIMIRALCERRCSVRVIFVDGGVESLKLFYVLNCREGQQR